MAFKRDRANRQRGSHRDASGRSLEDYPRPSVAVDTAVLTVDDGTLCVVLVRPSEGDDPSAHGRPRLPGTFLHEGERLADAVLRSLLDKAGVTGLDPRQLHVLDTAKAALAPVASLPERAYRHDAIVDLAVASLRGEYAAAPDPRDLLGAPFTLRDLQDVHEAVAGEPIPRDAFRRAMEDRLVPTGQSRRGVVGKPARLFTHGVPS